MGLEGLKIIMRERGFTSESLAEKSGVPKSTIDKILCGATPDPRYSTVKQLANTLNLTVDEIIDYLGINATTASESSIAAAAERLHKSPGLRMVFDAAEDVTEEALEATAEMLKQMKKDSGYE